MRRRLAAKRGTVALLFPAAFLDCATSRSGFEPARSVGCRHAQRHIVLNHKGLSSNRFEVVYYRTSLSYIR
jgi:hypothetical protein